MKPVVFVTANQSKHREVQKLLAGLDVRWQRLDLARQETDDLAAIARGRAVEAFERLGEPCFLESTGLWLWDHGGAPGASFKRIWRELGEEGFAERFGGSRGTSRVVVALAESSDPNDVRIFEGSVSGYVLPAPRGEGGYGWDRLFVPDGYDRTLGEMTTSTYFINMRCGAVPRARRSPAWPHDAGDLRGARHGRARRVRHGELSRRLRRARREVHRHRATRRRHAGPADDGVVPSR